MNRFVFSLERVRQWRHTQVELEQAKLQSLVGELHRLADEQERLKQEQDRVEAAVQDIVANGGSIEAGELFRLDDYRHHLLGLRAQNLVKQREQETRIEKQRQVFLDARRRFRLLDKLRQGALREWEKQYERELENLASELHLAGLARQQAARPNDSRLAGRGGAVEEVQEFRRVAGESGEGG